MNGAGTAAQDAAPHRIMLNEVGDLKQRMRAGRRSVGHGSVDHGRSAISAARQHAARWPPPQSCNGGYASWQRATASEQRGANAQPLGSLVNDGTVPGISASRASALPCSEGTAAMRAI